MPAFLFSPVTLHEGGSNHHHSLSGWKEMVLLFDKDVR